MEEDLRARLLAATTLAAIGGRISWVERPKQTGLPAITLTLVSEVPTNTYQGQDRLVPSHVQVDVWASSPGQAITLARAIRPIIAEPAVQGSTNFGPAYLDLAQDGGSEEIAQNALVYRRILDFTVWHCPA